MAALSESERLADGGAREGAGRHRSRTMRRVAWGGGFLALAAVAISMITLRKLTRVELAAVTESEPAGQEMNAGPEESNQAFQTVLEAPAHFQELSWADELQLQPGYLPPKDLYVFWGKSSFKGHGPLGRASSAERVRRVLKLGHFTGNSYINTQHGYGHFLYDWEGSQFRKMARSCCATVLVPPMESDLPLYWDSDKAARNIRNFVSNGNRLILTGGSYSSIVFLNRYFHFNVKKQIYDAGPFDRQPLRKKSLLGKAAHELPMELPQSGLAVTSVELESLPHHTDVLYASDSSSPLFEITFCEKVQHGLRGHWCSVHAGEACQEDTTPRQCRELRKAGEPCGCGTILYDGFDFVDNHKTWIGASVWDDTIRDAVKFPKLGTPGKAVWPAPSPDPPPPPPPSVWYAHVFWNYYDLVSVPDLQYLPLVGQGEIQGFIDFDAGNPLEHYVGELPDTNIAGVIYGKMYVEIPGFYTFCVRSRDGSRLWINEHVLVTNDGVHHLFRACAVREMREGFHDVVLDFFVRDGDANIHLTYSGPDTDDNIRRLNSWNNDAPPPPPGSDWDMRAYHTDLHTLTVVERTSGMDLVGDSTVPYINFDDFGDFQAALPGLPSVNFVYQFFGTWVVDVGGDYTLCSDCDEGSRLFFDGQLLLDNSAYDATGETCVDISLDPGLYDIKADGFQSGGDVYLRVSYEGPATRGNRQLVYSTEPNAPPVSEPSHFTMRIYHAPFELRDIPSMYNLNFVGETHDLPVIDLENHDAFRKFVPGTPDGSYAWEFFGNVHIQTGGYYEFCQTSDDGSITYIDSNVVVSDPGLHAAQQKCQQVMLGAGGHSVKLVGFDWGGEAFVKLEYSGPDTYGYRVLVVSDDSAAPERHQSSDWAFQCFCGPAGMANVPDMNSLSACGQTTVDYVNFPSMEEMNRAIPTCPLENVGWRFDGQIIISLEGTYYFCSSSDDGSLVYVDGNLVTNNDGLHGTVEQCGGIYLYSGPHQVRLDGFNAGGPGVQLLTYQGPDTSDQKLFPYSVNSAIPGGP